MNNDLGIIISSLRDVGSSSFSPSQADAMLQQAMKFFGTNGARSIESGVSLTVIRSARSRNKAQNTAQCK
jgi:hypothetical protein